MKLMTNGRKLLLTGLALTACLGFTLNAQAQCVVTNWAGGQPGLSNANAGTQDTAASSNRRYGGPCGLRVPIDGNPRSVIDDSPGGGSGGETTYIARFYTFLDNAGSGDILIFAADDGTDDQIQVWYQSGDLTLRVFDNGGTPTDRTFSAVGPGWHSVELVWESAASAEVLFSVDGASDMSATLATDTLSIENAELGNLNAADTSGEIDFDDFDSRRIERPGRLCRGLTDTSRTVLDLQDALNIFDEFASNGLTPAAGQPDYNEDGTVDFDDALIVFDRFATGNEDCSLNL